jgi:selenocysteine-specific elongation factor
LKGGKSPAARPLKDGTLVRVHLGSGNSPARVILQESGRLEPGQVVMAQLRFDRAVLAFLGDHFILRDSAEQFTLAGGVVLDPDASRKGFRSPGRSQFLRDCGTGESVGAVASAHLSRDGAVRRAALLLKSRFSAQEISGALADLVQKRQAILAGEWAAAKPWWDKMCRCAVEAIDAGHLAHPDRAGLALSELRARLGKELPSPELFDALLAELCASGFIQAGVFIRRATHRPALPPHLQAAGARLRAALAARPAEPPSRKELAPDAVAQQALRFLLQTGEAIELGEDVILLTESFVRMKEVIVRCLREKGRATVSDLRQLLGTTRRIMMPLLERLDRDGVTVRQGDLRTLRGDRAR